MSAYVYHKCLGIIRYIEQSIHFEIFPDITHIQGNWVIYSCNSKVIKFDTYDPTVAKFLKPCDETRCWYYYDPW